MSGPGTEVGLQESVAGSTRVGRQYCVVLLSLCLRLCLAVS